jgi:MoaD family protein
MSVKVKVPTIMRKHVGGNASVDADGASLSALLDDLEARYPGVTKNIRSEDGGLHRFINIYVNDEDVRYLGSLDAAIKEGDVISILPAVAGGR